MATLTETQAPGTTEVHVPDIGDFKDVPIVEVHVKPGDTINADDPLITLETDKASMEVPAPAAGRVRQVHVNVGDRVSEGSVVLTLETTSEGATTPPPSLVEQQEPEPRPASPPPVAPGAPAVARGGPSADGAAPGIDQVHASPSVRRLARELGVDLRQIRGTGEKGRITKDDVKTFLRGPAAAPAPAPATAAAGIPEIPAQDFSKFGPIESRPLSRIKR